MKLSPETIKKIERVTGSWNWENYCDENEKKYWTTLQALYGKLSWTHEHLVWMRDESGVSSDGEWDEYIDIVKDTMNIVEALQKDITI